MASPKSKLRMLLRVLIVLCAAGLLYSAAVLAAGGREYARGDAAYDRVRRQTQGREEDPAPGPQTPGAGADFAALGEINPDVVAWLAGDDGVIDYPVVRGDDNDYYLTHLFDGGPNKLGCLFVDYRAAGDFSGRNTTIYGHNMQDGSMFAPLTQYQAQDYYDAHPVLWLYTPKGAYTLQLFAGILGDGGSEFIRFDFADDADFLAYIQALRAASTFQSEVEVGAGDRIVSLSTCSYDFENARYVLFGRLTALPQP